MANETLGTTRTVLRETSRFLRSGVKLDGATLGHPLTLAENGD